MREIKFRGLNTKGEWVYGSLVNTTHGIDGKPHTKTWIITSAFGNGGWFNIMGREYVRPSTVGQFTGLYDRNGKEIYEGDVLKSQLGGIGIVKFHKSWGAFYYSMLTGKDEYGNIVKMIGSHHFYNESKKYEVIGNIFENPELLEAKT